MPIESYVSEPTTVDTFEEFYRREYPRLVAVARAMTGHRNEGEDAVQDAMVKAFVHWRRIGGYQSPGAWCLRVLTNVCRGKRRRRRTEERYLASRPEVRSMSEGPAIEFVAFWEAVRRLPERPRLVVTLFYAADLAIAEISTIAKVPTGTVKSDLARARIVLRAELER